MKVPTLQELLLLPESVAVARHLDGLGYGRLRWLLAVLLPALVLATAVSTLSERSFEAWLAGADLALLGLFLVLRNTRVVERAFRPVLLVLLAAQLVVVYAAVYRLQPAGAAHMVSAVAGLACPALLLTFRLRPQDALALAALGVGGGLWLRGEVATDGMPLLPWTIGVTLVNVLAIFGAAAFHRMEKQRFLGRFREEAGRERDRIRMRDELNDARRIQLSMLPPPELEFSWLEISSVSMPAAEVGGDYFDFIRLDDDTVVLVIADVAGHGVASGLMIAGLRSCLYLLQPELRSPAAVLGKLNRMVRDSVRSSRMLVTVTLAVVDRRAATLTVACAGHPPVLHCAPSGAVSEVGGAALPLGTRLPSRYREWTRPLAQGDFLLLYTDGLVEAPDYRERPYSYERLSSQLGKAVASGSVKKVRNELLDDVSRFKSDARQSDDFSLVVARYTQPAAPEEGVLVAAEELEVEVVG